eukprot:scaffold169628_cov18-Tisochrysis_lutea.AAC.2
MAIVPGHRVGVLVHRVGFVDHRSGCCGPQGGCYKTQHGPQCNDMLRSYAPRSPCVVGKAESSPFITMVAKPPRPLGPRWYSGLLHMVVQKFGGAAALLAAQQTLALNCPDFQVSALVAGTPSSAATCLVCSLQCCSVRQTPHFIECKLYTHFIAN